MTYHITLQEMGCDHCINTVTRYLTEQGFSDIKVTLGEAFFTADTLNKEVFLAEIDDIGYPATFIE